MVIFHSYVKNQRVSEPTDKALSEPWKTIFNSYVKLPEDISKFNRAPIPAFKRPGFSSKSSGSGVPSGNVAKASLAQ